MNNLLNLKNVLETTYQTKTKAKEYFHNKNYLNDSELSNISNRVYFNPETNKAILTFRGTKNLINDIPADLDVLLGTNYFGNRENEAQKFYKEVKKKYPNYQLTLAGNSLGGTLASNVSKDKNDKIITHNKGAGLLEPFKKSKSNEIIYRNPADLISFTSSNKSNVKNIGRPSLNLLHICLKNIFFIN